MSSAAATSLVERSLLTIHCLTTYKEACQRGEVAIGKMLVVETNQLHGPTYVINFPTKKHWRTVAAVLHRRTTSETSAAASETSAAAGAREIGAQSPSGGAVLRVFAPGTCAGDRTIPRRRPATAGVCNARRGLGGPRDQQPPAQSVVRR